MPKVTFRKPFTGDELEHSLSASLVTPVEEDLTIQSAKDETDINVLVKRFGVTGAPRHNRPMFYADFSDVSDYQAALDRVREAHDSFAELPAEVRDRFDNDPAKVIRFLEDPRNREESIRLGLREAPPAPPTPEPAPAPPAPPEGS